MKLHKVTFLSLMVLACLWNYSCTKPTLVGADLLEQDQANIRFTDTVSFNTQTIHDYDSVIAYVPNNAFQYFYCGDVDDPIFGNINTQIFTQIRYTSNSVPDFSSLGQVDSLVLKLAYYGAGTFGDTTESYNIGVYRLTEDMKNDTNYYSNHTFLTESSPLATYTFNPTPNTSRISIDSTTTNGTTTYDTTVVEPSLNIRLPGALADELIHLDSAAYSSPDEFVKSFKGVLIKPEAKTKCLLGFDFDASVTGMWLYFKNTGDTVSRAFFFPINNACARFTNIKHDFTNSIVKSSFANLAAGDTILYSQGFVGPDIQIDIPYIQNLGKVSINKAELEFTVAEVGDNPQNYQPISQLVIGNVVSSDTLTLISDVLYSSSNSFGPFGGRVEKYVKDGTILKRYRFNISAYLQDMKEGVQNQTIFITPYVRQESSGRVVLYGPKHPLYPAKLNITYTKLN